MHLVVDIGNTETVLGLLGPSDPVVIAHWRLTTGTGRTADEIDHLVHSFLARRGFDAGKVQRAVVGSVVPSMTERMTAALGGLVDGPVFIVEAGADLPVRLDVDEPKTVGADRIVNTLAAKRLYKRDTIVVDLGTATTFDCITGDGVFVGGVIAPGVQVGLEWLGRRAAKLPKVQFRSPDAVIGRRTETCMESGVFFSTVDAIDGIVTRIRVEWNRPDALVVATGGYAELITGHCRTISSMDPHLTLKGLFFAGEHLAGK